MKVKDTLRIDKIFYTLPHKIENFLGKGESKQYGLAPHGVQKITNGQFPSWQYNGAAPFDDVLDWCEEAFGDNFVWNYETIYFKHEQDKTVFLLKWT